MEIFNKAVNPTENKFSLPLGIRSFSFHFSTLYNKRLLTGRTKCDHIRNISKISDFFVAKKEKETGFGYEDQTFLEINE